MIVRKVQEEDLEAIERLIRGIESFTEEETNIAIDLVTQAVIVPQNGYDTLVAVENGIVVGLLCFGRTPLTERTFDLYWLAVKKDYRRKGVGKALHDAFLTCIRQQDVRLVRVETSTKPTYNGAIKFYESLGY